MKHIETTAEEETKAKANYKEVQSDLVVEASEEIEQAAHQLLAVLREIDEKSLEASRLKGVIMEAMKKGATLKGRDGNVLCTWLAGNMSNSIDYKGLFKKYNVTPEDIKAYTTTKQNARRFSLEIG